MTNLIVAQAGARRGWLCQWSLVIGHSLTLWLAVLSCGAAGLSENFTSDPLARGWRIHGDASLFRWNATNGTLDVTWDSSRPNSFFARPLGNVVTKSDDFALEFDLRLDEVIPGPNTNKPSTFQVALGLLNWRAATNNAFRRGTGHDSPHLVEFSYFPEADFIAATVSPAITSSNSQFATSFTYPLAMPVGDAFNITLRYTATNRTLVTTMTRNGLPFGPVESFTLGASFTDFRADTLSINSYSDVGDLYGSIFAGGVVDNIVVTLPPPPISGLILTRSNSVSLVEFTGRTNWLYTLEVTEDLVNWTRLPPAQAGFDGRMTFSETNAAASQRFHRIRAERP